jgi:hypothetical protein
VKFRCPKCKRPLKAKPEILGMRVQCPTCGLMMRLPCPPIAAELKRFYVRSAN